MTTLEIGMLIFATFALLTLGRVVWEVATRNRRPKQEDVWAHADVSGWGHRID